MPSAWLVVFSVGLLLGGVALAQEERSPIVVQQTEGEFEFVMDDLRNAILGQGMIVNGILHLGDMLDRTAEDLGYGDRIFERAESVEFCSAALAQRMTRADPSNLSICPFTIALYTLAGQPDRIYLAYRHPNLTDAAEVEREVREMFEGIIGDVLDR